MPRKRSSPYPGLNVVRKRLADGSRATYYYAWKGGPRIEAPFGSPDFAKAFREATESRQQPRVTGTLLDVLNAYQRSRGRGGSGKGFLDLAERTRADYVKIIRVIEREFGDMPLGALRNPDVRRDFLDWRDRLAEKSERQADYAFTVLARILSWAEDRRIIPANPCLRAGRIYHGSRAEIVWTDADEAAFLEVARPEVALAYMLAVWTGQRQGDCLRLAWSAYDGETIRVRQSKTGRTLAIPVGAPLKAMLDAAPRRSPVILVNSDGKPWKADGFRTAWRRTQAKAKVIGKAFTDLRGTAVTRLAVAGCTVPQIAAITGHSNAEVSAILDKHYLAHDPALGRAAIRKLETRGRAEP